MDQYKSSIAFYPKHLKAETFQEGNSCNKTRTSEPNHSHWYSESFKVTITAHEISHEWRVSLFLGRRLWLWWWLLWKEV